MLERAPCGVGRGARGRALGVTREILTSKRKRPHPGVAVAVWRLTGIPVEVLLSGRLALVPATLGAPPAPRPPA